MTGAGSRNAPWMSWFGSTRKRSWRQPFCMRIWRSCTNSSLHTGAEGRCPSPRPLRESDQYGRREMSPMIRPMEQFVKTLLAARRVSTPLVAIRTADPALTVARIEEAVGKDAAIVQWDIVRGLVRVNDAGAKEIGKVLGERDSASVGPVDALVAACQLGEDAVLVFANAQRFWNDPQVAQAIWNLRDVFKANGRTLTLLTTPGAVLPDELPQHVLVLNEPLPAVEDLTRILDETIAAAEVPELETDASEKADEAME